MTALLRDQPFFGSLALRLPIRPDAARETLASDGREIRYSPDWVANTDADLIKTAIGRVVLACALKHHTRRGEREPGRWQQASQLVTHGLLRDAGFKLPPDAEAWDGISVEQAYDRLPEPQEDGGREATAHHRQGAEAAQPVRNLTTTMTTAAATTITVTAPPTHPTTAILKPTTMAMPVTANPPMTGTRSPETIPPATATPARRRAAIPRAPGR